MPSRPATTPPSWHVPAKPSTRSKLCSLLCAFTKDNEVTVSILGSDMDIAKMLMTVTTVARHDIVQANSPFNPTNEVLQ